MDYQQALERQTDEFRLTTGNTLSGLMQLMFGAIGGLDELNEFQTRYFTVVAQDLPKNVLDTTMGLTYLAVGAKTIAGTYGEGDNFSAEMLQRVDSAQIAKLFTEPPPGTQGEVEPTGFKDLDDKTKQILADLNLAAQTNQSLSNQLDDNNRTMNPKDGSVTVTVSAPDLPARPTAPGGPPPVTAESLGLPKSYTTLPEDELPPDRSVEIPGAPPRTQVTVIGGPGGPMVISTPVPQTEQIYDEDYRRDNPS
ncbi:hypothetical protein ACWDV4_01455 [Micromonospora sp. NPDC003197]